MRQEQDWQIRVKHANLVLFVLKGLCLFAAGGIASAQNPIVIENRQLGTSAWKATLAGSDAVGQIKGYASATSINKGDNITFYVTVNPAQTFTIDVYRMGWYQGLGARLMQHIGPLNGFSQATCPTDVTTGMIECHWTPVYTLATQTSWTSGVYAALLTNSQGYQNYIMFAVRDDNRVAALLYQQDVATYQAYSNYPNDNATGKSLYAFNSNGAITVSGGKNAVKVSFDRPYVDNGLAPFLSYDYPFIRWLEMSGYDVTYSTDVDTHTNGQRLLNYRGVLSVGHNEYFSRPMYDAFVNARDGGVNLGFFTSDAIDWQVRFESSSSGVPNRVVVCYRYVNLDPVADATLKTVEWKDPPLNRPPQMLVGVQYLTLVGSTSRGWAPYFVTNSGHWVYSGTGFKDGDQVPGIVGYEADTVFSQFPLPNALPATYTLLSNSFLGVTGYYGNSTIYQAASGAWVFATGANAWSWGLDNYQGYNDVDPRIQRTTANILNQFVYVPPPDFKLSVSPANRSVNPGGATSYSIIITPTGGFASQVTLSVSGLPTGANASFTPNPATGLSTLSVTTSTSTPLGTYTLTISGVSGSLAHTVLPTNSPTLTITNPGVTGWYSSSWSARKSITINHAKVSGSSNLTNFPVLFSVTDANLMSTAYGGQVAQSNGYDILFTASDGVTKLNHELNSYMASSGKVVAWVQVATLSPSADTTIYIYYGNAAAVNQQNPSAVWDINFKAVWHFGDGSTLSPNDSTADGYNGTISNATAGSGEIAGAGSFNGSNATINLLPWTTTNTSSATISFWINPNSVSTSKSIYGTYATDPEDTTKDMYIDMGEPLCGGSSNIRFILSGAACTTSNILNAGTWTYVVIVYDGTQPTNTTKVTVYSNGVMQTLSGGGGTMPSTLNIIDLRHQIGRFYNSYFNGLLDEFRLSNSIRSAAWIATEYNNQSSPSTFLTVGPQNNGGAPTITGLSPSSATAGGAGFTLTVNGTNFVSGATVQWGATALATTFVSATQVTAMVTAGLIATAGGGSITVTTTGGTSAGATFTINQPPPTITGLSPSSATAGGAGFTLTVNGTNFVSGATVQWGATALATTFVNATQVTAMVTAGLIATAGAVSITVTTAGGTSGTVTFTINSNTGGWYSSSWSHRKAITINHTKVSGSSNLSNFPVLFSVTDTNLMSAAYGGQVAQSNGYDILFTASDGVTKLNHELNSYMASSGKVVAWVQVATLSPSADTTIYIYYGNASAANQQNPSGVWDINFKAVWHFGDGSTLSPNDSTADGYNGTISNATAGSGEIAGAGSFNGSNATIDINTNVSNNTPSATISFWINPSSVSTSQSIYGTYATDPEDATKNMYIDMGEPFCGGSSNIRFILSGAACTTSNILSAGTWTNVVIVYDGTQPTNTTKVTVYSNGVMQTLSDGGGTMPSTLNIIDLRHQIGRFYNSYFNGLLDEFRLSNSIRSAAWITTEYNNQSSPSTFYAVGPQQ